MLGYPGHIYSATLLFDWTGNWTPVMMILMPVGLVGADHIEAGPVVALIPLYHTWPSSAQHIQGPLVTPHDSILGHATLLLRSPGVDKGGMKGVLPIFPPVVVGKLLGGGMRKYCCCCS